MTTLAQLKTSTDAWLARDDIAVTGDDFPQILLIAESLIARKIRLIEQEVTTTLTFTGRSADLPADFLEPRNPFIDDNTRKFEYMTPQTLRESEHWSNGRVGSFYTLEGSRDGTNGADDRVKMIIAGPASASNPLDVEVNYVRRFTGLVDSDDTNWLLTNHFDAYLFAVLVSACRYMRKFAEKAAYEADFKDVIDDLGKIANRKRFGSMPKQSYGNPRGVV